MPISHRCVRTLLLIAPAFTIPAATASARPAAVPSSRAESAPFLGTWELDLTRMPANYGPPPKRVVYTIEDVGAAQWRTTIDITAPDGSVRHTTIRYRRDGTMAAGEGDTSEADSAAISTPVPNVMIMSLSKNKAQGSVRVYIVSADGKEMIESAANVDGTGAPFVRSFHFRRIR